MTPLHWTAIPTCVTPLHWTAISTCVTPLHWTAISTCVTPLHWTAMPYLCDAPALDGYALGELLTLTLLQVRQGRAALLRVLPLGSYQHADRIIFAVKLLLLC